MPKQILQINTSIRNANDSYSSRNAAFAVEKIKEKFPGSTATVWDLSVSPIPYLTAEWDTAAHTPEELRDENQKQLLEQVNMRPLLENEIYVIGLAGYDYDMPAVFKSFLEHMVQFDVTVNSDWSPRLLNKEVIVITAWGGGNDSLEPEIGYEYVLKKAFGALGIHNIKIFNIYRTDDITSTEDDVQEQIAKYVAEMN